MAPIRVAHLVENPGQGTAELHYFWEQAGLSGVVETRVQVVPQHAGPSVAFLLHGHWGQAEIRDGTRPGEAQDLLEGQAHEEAALDEIGDFLAGEGGMLIGGLVGSLGHDPTDAFLRPGWVGAVHGHTLLAVAAEEVAGWVLEVLESVGEMGFAVDAGGEGLPRGGGRQVSRHTMH
jgi:hypothetical protein